ncbi:hypothetical protein DXD24_08240 [Collinsella sp. TF12-2AT]|nr:hypothetical protein DXD48_08085 [Collinsella sp. TM05-37]RGK21983.1 hypothetical protein DXD24_08240 [Collinsella sp. TF12-2AT]RHC28494.1 hypothetical protein DW850_08660 [Collinsella sp. AM36-4AA]RHF96332.1 hypothetical protein DW645_08145 [Collinsella sp. AM23-17]
MADVEVSGIGDGDSVEGPAHDCHDASNLLLIDELQRDIADVCEVAFCKRCSAFGGFAMLHYVGEHPAICVHVFEGVHDLLLFFVPDASFEFCPEFRQKGRVELRFGVQ